MRVLVTGVVAGLVTLAIVTRPVAQPTPAPDMAHAKELYDSATAAMTAGHFAEAARDFTAAYDITHDPVLFFKIASANDKGGTCGVALVYYARYLRDAKPEPRFVTATNERIIACGGTIDDHGSGSGAGSATLAGSAAGSDAGSDGGSGAGSAGTTLALGSGADKLPAHPRGRDAAWLMVGGALAFVTAGAVLAYSASSSEQDIKDLYVGLDGNPAMFDAQTAQRYHDLVDEGHRYQDLSWISFGIAAGFAATATILFVRDHDSEQQRRLMIVPTASPQSAGVSATLRF